MPEYSADFDRLRESGRPPGPGLALGTAVVRLRDGVGRLLAGAGVTPNAITWAALAAALGASACLAAGAGDRAPWSGGSLWPLAAGALLTLSALADTLDGAVARIAGLRSEWGALLDSTLDRVADAAIFLGCAVHFAAAGNVTYVLLSVAAAGGALLVSYVKTRAEDFVPDCRVGYWQRGERLVFLLAAAWMGHVPAVLWVLAIGPLLTVSRRLRHARALLAGRTPPAGLGAWAVWRHPRGSIGYDLATAGPGLVVIAGPWAHPLFTAGADPVRSLLGA